MTLLVSVYFCSELTTIFIYNSTFLTNKVRYHLCIFLFQAAKASGVSWVVPATEKANYDIMFKQADTDTDGFVSGADIKDIFLQSGIPPPVLAHIW